MPERMNVDFPHKIFIPQRPAYLVHRPRLAELLQGIVDRRLITLTAPAGYGKTSLLIDFASASAPLPICWYTLDPFDADPWVFLSYLVASIEQRFPGAAHHTTARLEGHARTPFATAAAALIRDIYAIQRDFIIIIDDWHLVDHIADIRDVLSQLLLHCPHCHLILASRSYPGLPNLMLLFARRQQIGLDEEQLRFTADEISAVLGAEYRTAVPLDQAELLAEQLGGWIAGILMSVQATRLATPVPLDARAERQVYQFLAEQVLEQQPPELRAFLLESALLDELTPERCDAIFARTDSSVQLEMLLRHHLFISEIKPGVLRYHPLFREFLQEQFRKSNPQRYRTTALRVADAYAEQKQWPLAFDMYVLAGDLPAARRVVAAGGEHLFVNGRLETLERWFGVLPLDDLDASLLCLKARVLLDRGLHHEAQALADLAQSQLRPGEEIGVLLLQSQLARIAGRYEDALAVVRRVLECAAEDGQRAMALRTQAICHHRLGQPELAIAELKQALTLERQRGDLYATAVLQSDLAICYTDIGRLLEAEEHYSQADACFATIGNTGSRAMSLNGKGVVQHLAGRYRDAHATLTSALQYAHDASVPDYQATILVSLGDLYSDLQLWARASAAYSEARRVGGSAYLMSYTDLAVARLLVRQRQYASAARALQQLSETTVRRHHPAVLLLRGGIAWGQGHYDQAGDAVEQAIPELEQSGAWVDVARAYLLRAQIAGSMATHDTLVLCAALEQAAQIAGQLGHDAFLVAETLHISNVLRRASAAGWSRAGVWLERHQELRLAAQMLEQDDGRPLVAVRTFGADQISLNGQVVDIGWLKAREVLYYLLAHPEGATADMLTEAIWPDLDPERARGTLRAAIFRLRATLPSELIELHGRRIYRLNPVAARIDDDVARFLQILDVRCADGDLDSLCEAVDLYRGPYLPWSENTWSRDLRMYLEQRYLRALRDAACCAERAGLLMDALHFYQSTLSVDQLDEMAHAGVMRCQIALGNRAAAIGQYRTLRRLLNDELGIEPAQSSEVEQLYLSILSV